jgi:signal transduction histidine kinase
MNAMSWRLQQTISELKAANIKLQKEIDNKQQIDDMRKEFLSHVSHELKTPIALIQGYAEGLKDMADDEESREFYTDVIIDEAQKMNEMVKKLLDLNEIEFGTEPLKIERFELVEFLSQIISTSQILTENSNANIHFDEKPPVYVWADEYMIEEVFTNLLTNAIHYVKEGGIIRVSLEKNGDDVRVLVYNQGDRIADEDIDKLFIKFYKADKARTREYGGSGIGLSIVAATMEAHNKKYGVYNVDDGVVFYFDLDANIPC